MDSKGVNLVRKITCPKCARELGTVDTSKTTVNVSTKCTHCHIGVTFVKDTNEIVEKPYPARVTSGGMRF